MKITITDNPLWETGGGIVVTIPKQYIKDGLLEIGKCYPITIDTKPVTKKRR